MDIGYFETGLVVERIFWLLCLHFLCGELLMVAILTVYYYLSWKAEEINVQSSSLR
jgi:hypothetical protein